MTTQRTPARYIFITASCCRLMPPADMTTPIPICRPRILLSFSRRAYEDLQFQSRRHERAHTRQTPVLSSRFSLTLEPEKSQVRLYRSRRCISPARTSRVHVIYKRFRLRVVLWMRVHGDAYVEPDKRASNVIARRARAFKCGKIYRALPDKDNAQSCARCFLGKQVGNAKARGTRDLALIEDAVTAE